MSNVYPISLFPSGRLNRAPLVLNSGRFSTRAHNELAALAESGVSYEPKTVTGRILDACFDRLAVPEEYTAFSERVSDLFKRAVEVAELSLNDTQTGTKISGELLPMLLQEMRRAVEDSRTVELSAPMQFEKDAQGLIFGTVNATTDHEVLYTTTDVAYDAIAVAYTAIAAAVVAVVGIAVVFVGSEQTPAASLSGKHLNYDAFHRLARILATNAHRVEPRQVH